MREKRVRVATVTRRMTTTVTRAVTGERTNFSFAVGALVTDGVDADVLAREVVEPGSEGLAELVELFCATAPASLEPARAQDWAAAVDDAGRLRVVVDQVASLTDAAATALHARLTGRGTGRPDRPGGS